MVCVCVFMCEKGKERARETEFSHCVKVRRDSPVSEVDPPDPVSERSEEHTSELQSQR